MSERDSLGNKEETGKTAWDVVAKIPVWLLSIAALVFVAIVGNAMIFATQQVELGFLGKWGPTQATPEPEAKTPLLAGAVVAFDRSEKNGGACPAGWSLFESAGGRMIVGAGTNTNKDQNGIPLTDYPSFKDDSTKSIGGEERVTLSVSQIPEHTHAFTFSDGTNSPEHVDKSHNEFGLKNATEQTGPAGEGQSHNNMPPFIALYFCKKN
ncbi:hypothetical protein [Labrenzia sp. PHM005]|uniref:hypothetical protein n=1 Tax=Labrenzia sp. PHM005 TaxID=2590016 RepID=UPI00114012B7|nr:hypothetical protein [Labrenzia sp. PHM005]QDG74422.1 hypothetical protein FJ695_00220 [Labrenzia sp. PHM005]